MPVAEDFPPQSFDINIIEGVWAWLQGRVQGRRPVSIRGLETVINKEWKAIKQTSIDKLVAQVPRRLKKIVEGRGRWLSNYKE